jgi:hypothetical protein
MVEVVFDILVFLGGVGLGWAMGRHRMFEDETEE